MAATKEALAAVVRLPPGYELTDDDAAALNAVVLGTATTREELRALCIERFGLAPGPHIHHMLLVLSLSQPG